jgi:molecular chaperone GrpE
MAEFDNYRRRSIEEKSDWIKRATEKLALTICDVLDNFDRALMQVNEEQKEDNFIKGIILIDQQLKAALEKEGVKRIDALGHDFDPKLHDALANIPSEYEEGKVAAIIQNGYTMHEKLIRPVRVAVSTGTGNNDTQTNEE